MVLFGTLAESHLTRWLFGSMPRRIDALPVKDGASVGQRFR